MFLHSLPFYESIFKALSFDASVLKNELEIVCYLYCKFLIEYWKRLSWDQDDRNYFAF